jgi:hypothetical protein
MVGVRKLAHLKPGWRVKPAHQWTRDRLASSDHATMDRILAERVGVPENGRGQPFEVAYVGDVGQLLRRAVRAHECPQYLTFWPSPSRDQFGR